MPNEVEVLPDTEIWALSAADDGTLFAGVKDLTASRWGNPPGSVLWAVFYSIDGGYSWYFGWNLPGDDPGPVVDLVAAPGYTHPGTIFFTVDFYLYYSTDGGDTFYRTFSVCPGVAGDPTVGLLGGVITSLDVAIDADAPDEYVAVVGTNWGQLDGVYTWNLGGVPIWQDMEIGNRIAAAWDTGNEGVLEVRFSPNYPTDRVIVAVANYDPCIISPPWTGPSDFTTVISVYDGTAGTWGIQYMDAAIWTVPGVGGSEPSNYARLVFFDNFAIESSPHSLVAIDGTNVDDVYRVKMLPPSLGPSKATALLLGPTGDSATNISDLMATGSVTTATAYVACNSPTGQPKVYRGKNLLVSPVWTQFVELPWGAWPVSLAMTDGTLVAAAGSKVYLTNTGNE